MPCWCEEEEEEQILPGEDCLSTLFYFSWWSSLAFAIKMSDLLSRWPWRSLYSPGGHHRRSRERHMLRILVGETPKS